MITKLPLDEANRMVRLGFGKHDGRWFARIDLWQCGFRLTRKQKTMDEVERFDQVGGQMIPSVSGMWVQWSVAADEVSNAWKSSRVVQKRLQTQEDNPPKISGVHNANAYFDWSWKGRGFGQLSFHYDYEKRTWSCMNECLDRDSVRKLLHALADHIADNVTLPR